MNNICTSIEQSQKLIELGIDVNTADMYHAPDANVIVAEPYITKYRDETHVPAYKGAIPAWSLAALLAVLPSGYVIVKNYHGLYYVESRDHERSTNIFNNSVDACVKMILELHKFKVL